MAHTIEIGTLLVKEGTPLPENLPLESDPYLKGWRLVKNLDSSGIDRKLCEAGWTFFFLAGDVDATAVGSDGRRIDITRQEEKGPSRFAELSIHSGAIQVFDQSPAS